MYILAGDAGGTQTRLALFEQIHERESFECRTVSDFDSRSATSLDAIVRDFLERHTSLGRMIPKRCFKPALPAPIAIKLFECGMIP